MAALDVFFDFVAATLARLCCGVTREELVDEASLTRATDALVVTDGKFFGLGWLSSERRSITTEVADEVGSDDDSSADSSGALLEDKEFATSAPIF